MRNAVSSAPTGPCPSADSMCRVPCVRDLHGRLGERRLVVADAFLDVHAVALDLEERLRPPAGAAHQQLERGFRDVERVAARLALLDLLDHGGDRRVVELEPELRRLHADRRAAAVVGGDDAAAVADRLGRHVLVGARDARDPARVQPGLVRERVAARVRLARVGGEVRDVGDVVRQLGEVLDRALGQRVGRAHLQHEVGGERDQVGVAGALAVAVDRALHLVHAGVDRDERVRDRAPGVVVHVDAERHARLRLARRRRRARRRTAACRRSCRRARGARRRLPRPRRAPPSRTSRRTGSRRRSARRRRTPAGPAPRRNATDSRTIATPSSRSVRSASVTCRSHALPTRQTTSVPASSRSRSACDSSARSPARRVMPNAVSVLVFSVSFVASWKNSVSRGFAPGHPPSTYGKPIWSSLCRMRSRSSTVYDRSACCAPSRKRRVVELDRHRGALDHEVADLGRGEAHLAGTHRLHLLGRGADARGRPGRRPRPRRAGAAASRARRSRRAG